jgi:signal transduction histidine kinase/ActR/RegA family two-component response regulator
MTSQVGAPSTSWRARLADMHRILTAIWILAGLLICTLLGTAVALTQLGRSDALVRASQLAEQTVAQAENTLNRTLLEADLVLSGAGILLASALDSEGRLRSSDAHRVLAELEARQLAFADIALLDAAGQIRAAAVPATRRLGLPLEPGFLDRALAVGSRELVLSGPTLGSDQVESVVLAARVVQVGREPALVAVAALPLSLLTPAPAMSRSQSLPPGTEITVETADGLLVATLPPNDPRIGRRLSVSGLEGLDDGVARAATARLREAPARLATRWALAGNLRVTASVDNATALMPTRSSERALIGGSVVIVLLLLGATALAHWQFVRLAAARREAAHAVQTLDQALASVVDGFLLCDADERVLRWNERYVQLFPWLREVLAPGVPFARLAERAAQAVLPDAPEEARRAWIDRRIRLHREAKLDWEQELGNGVLVRGSERRTPEGGIVSLYRDVTAEERRLSHAKAAAEAANEAKSRFLATMSHEMRTPLHAVMGLNQLLLSSNLDAEQRRHAELIGSSGELLLTVINDVLDMSRIEAGRFEMLQAPFEPARVASELCGILRSRAVDKGLALHLVVAPQTPARLIGDAMRLRQVLFNLVGNALKFTEHGTVEVRLAPVSTGGLSIEVEDTGIGIEPAALARLFERFTQADSSPARRFGGSGLGLAITRELVRLMGGDVEVRSEAGLGSCFRVTLPFPLAPADELSAETTAAAELADAAPISLRVLVAEDNPVNQMLAQAMLEQLGHESVVVNDGAEAVDAVAQGGFDLILMDMQMPRLDGVSAARSIRELPGTVSRTPIIAMTANARQEDRQACLEAGMDGYVSKPIDRDTLQRAIAEVAASDSLVPAAGLA